MNNSKTKTSAMRIKAAEGKAMALTLREAGLTYDQIAKQIGCTLQRAHQYVTSHLQELAKQADKAGGALLQMELERLDRIQSGIWVKAKGGDLRAVDRVIRIIEVRCKLLGINAPVKIAATTADGEDAPRGVVVVPAPAGSIEEWLEQADQWAQKSG